MTGLFINGIIISEFIRPLFRPFWGNVCMQRKKGVALYKQITDELCAKIDSGEWPPDTRLPSEPELAEHFGVCRMTVRQALGELESRGTIIRQRGRGTFVAQQKFIGDIVSFRLPDSFGSTHALISVKKLKADAFTAEQLGVEKGAPIVELYRIRFYATQNEPAELEISLMTRDVFSLIKDNDFTRPIYKDIKQKLGFVTDSYLCEVLPVALDAEQAKHLKLAEGTLALMLHRTWLGDGKPVMFTKLVFSPEKNRYVLGK